ncbi:MAG TPA: hypothetical protein PK360_01075 [bacterium]|nr:hypothetical protein [bacterium]
MNWWSERKSRRELLRTGARHLALGGLAVFGGIAWNRRRSAKQDEACRSLDPCQVCQVLKNCTLPRALSVKTQDKEAHRGQS